MPKILLHTCRLGDVEDPYLYASFPIGEWQQTDHGKWCMEHLQGEGEFWCKPDPEHFGYRVDIVGTLSDQDAVFHELKWGHAKKLV